MKSKNSPKGMASQKAVKKKSSLEKTAYYTLRKKLYPLQTGLEDIRTSVWDLESLLREREWEASEKKMALETRHSFKLYAEWAKKVERSLRAIIRLLDKISIKN